MTEKLITDRDAHKSVFLSYAHEDKAMAQLLAVRLQDSGVRVWLDTHLEPGVRWQDIVDSKLRTSDYFIALISNASLQSKHFHNEVLRQEFVRELSDRMISIIPVVLDDVEVPSSLRGLLHLDFRRDLKVGIDKLVAALAPTIDIDFSVLSPVQFEGLIADLLANLGFEVEREVTFEGCPFDFRVPVTRTDPFGLNFVEHWLIEVKHYSTGRLSAALVAKYAHLALTARDQNTRIALVTSSQVTSAARELVQNASLRLIEGIELKRILLGKPELARKHFTGRNVI